MKHTVLAIAFVSVILCAAVAFGQTPPCAPGLTGFTCRQAAKQACPWYAYWCNDRLSPVTKRKLYEHDPNVCHCDECRRARLAAGIEYMGLDWPVYTPRRRVIPPPLYTPPKPQSLYGSFRAWCAATQTFIPRDQCPEK
jgi:hypothetical protein